MPSDAKPEDEPDHNARVFAHPRLLQAYIVIVTAVVVGLVIWGTVL